MTPLLYDLDAVFASEMNARRMALLKLLGREVVVHSKDTSGVWFAFPPPPVARLQALGEPEAASQNAKGGPQGEARLAHCDILLAAMVSVRAA